jgi:subtilisin family serine protease
VRRLAAVVAIALVVPAVVSAPSVPADAAAPGPVADVALPRGQAAIAARIEAEGRARVIVMLRTTHHPEGSIDDAAVDAQRRRIARVADGLERELAGSDAGPVERHGSLASVVVEVGPTGLERLLRSPRVASIEPDLPLELTLDSSLDIIGADVLHAAGIEGHGHAVAVLDTGVDTAHPFFAGRVVAEACFSSDTGSQETLCPDGTSQQIGPGSGVNCPLTLFSQCFHGTFVAGIAAASHTTYGGVAPAADIIAVQVFNRSLCNGTPCLRASEVDLIAALDHVAELVDALEGVTRIAAVNLSLGGGAYSASCDGLFPAMTAAVANLASKGVAVIAASGNESRVGQIAYPACLTGTVAVGATTKSDTVASYSNGHATLVDLLAPGSDIMSAYPDLRLVRSNGTSAAAPHVAGAWALLRSVRPTDSDAQILAAMRAAGVPVTDTRTGAGYSTPRLALATLLPPLEELEDPEDPGDPADPVDPDDPDDPAEPDDPTIPDPPELGTGLLRVTTSPAVVSAIIVDGVHRADWGLDWLSLPVGTYEVCFGDVPGFRTPACRSVSVAQGVTTVVEGQFVRLGLLKVDVLPGGLPATIHVDGEWRDEYGLFAYVDPGTYEVCWGDVPGHTAPACATATVASGATTTVIGTYVPSATPSTGPAPLPTEFGYLRATTSPAVVSSIRVNGVVRGDWGLNWVKVPAGTHEVCFSGVPGFQTPACRTVEVLPGVTTETQGSFQQLGLLRVDVEPSVAIDVVIDGVPRNQFGLFSFFAAGTYEVCGTAAPDGRTAPCVQAVVVPGQQTRVILRYG